jgi:hypothetical protein
MKKVFFVLTFLFIFLFLCQVVQATTIFSPLLEMEVEPGQTERGIVKVFNETENDLYLVSSVEPFTAGDETGQPIYLAPEAKDEFLKWFKVEFDSIYLAPRDVAIVPFSLTVPTQATPGGYYAVIFWEDKPLPTAEEVNVGISGKVGTLIFLKVKGELVEKGEVIEFSLKSKKNYFFEGPISFVVRLSNSGNIHLKPKGEIELENWLGQTLDVLEINQEGRNVLPESIRRFEVVWGQSFGNNKIWQDFWPKLKQELSYFPFGRFTAILNLTYGVDNPQTITEKINFWFIPVRLIVSLIVIIIILIILIKINSKIKKLKKPIQSKTTENKNLAHGK